MGLWNVTLTGENGGSYVTHSWLPSMHDNLDSETVEIGWAGWAIVQQDFAGVKHEGKTGKDNLCFSTGTLSYLQVISSDQAGSTKQFSS